MTAGGGRQLHALIVVALLIGIGVLVWMAAAVLGRVENIAATIVIAILFAYMIFPAVRLLSARMPRALAVVVVYLIALSAVGVAVAYVAPTIAAEATSLSRRVPAALAAFELQAAHPAKSTLLNRFPPEIRSTIVQSAARAETWAGALAGGIGAQAFGVLRGTATFGIDVVIMLTVAFFLITDVERIRVTALRLVPPGARLAARSFLDEVDGVLSGFARGQVLLAIIIGITVTVILLVTGVPDAVLLGAFAGLVTVIPLVGEYIGAIPVFLVALLTAGPLRAAIVLVLFLLAFELQARVLAPIIVGKSVGVSPLVIFVAILLGAEAFGILGMVLAVPIAGVARVALDRFAPTEGPVVDAER